MAQLIQSVATLPDTGSDWLYVHGPIVDIAISLNHFPVVYNPKMKRWMKISGTNGVLDNYLRVEALDHFYHA